MLLSYGVCIGKTSSHTSMHTCAYLFSQNVTTLLLCIDYVACYIYYIFKYVD